MGPEFGTFFSYKRHSKVKHGEKNAKFRKPIRIEKDGIRCRGRWNQAESQSDLQRVTSMVTASIGARLKWDREHGNWTVSDWGNVTFTDESRFPLELDDKRIRIWRKQVTRNQPQNLTEHNAFQGGSIMVGAGISLGYRTDLHIFKRDSVTAVRIEMKS
ncbi:transposable element Tcb1 transposase [Trichonephila clavipes]|uniref:Transposable element Tcb1 transposase n=1 Tax=Trichonephila clavipes TaxID=2585209 RepID=A0A8X6SYJ6_TRICX|nr:transposable element Tcb1 transposase [Trichonephila clavipes]